MYLSVVLGKTARYIAKKAPLDGTPEVALSMRLIGMEIENHNLFRLVRGGFPLTAADGLYCSLSENRVAAQSLG